MAQAAPDVVYVVRPGEANEELRFSLRSLTNLPHSRVWIAGHKPAWVSPAVGYIPVGQGRGKATNSNANLRAACMRREVSDTVLLFNDDFFVTRPIERVTVLHCGPVAEAMTVYGGRYRAAAEATANLLHHWGYPDPLSYELHVPFPFVKPAMAELLDWAAHVPGLHHRTLYGNVIGVGGTHTTDVKVYQPTDEGFDREGPFLSTSDASFPGKVGAWLRDLFCDPSPYERR